MNEKIAIGLMKQSLNEEVDVPEISLSKRKGWLARHVSAVSAVACLVVALVLLVSWVGRMGQPSFSFNESLVRFAVLIIALYCLVKGVFTLAFHLKESKFDVSVHQFLIKEAYNRRYFVYEKLVWLWVLLPALLVMVPALFGIAADYQRYYWLVAAAVFIVVVFVFSLPLVRKLKQLKQEIKQLNNQITN